MGNTARPGASTPGSRQQRLPWRTLLATCAVAAALTALAPIAELVTGGSIETMELLSDPAELTGAPWYLGALSSITLLVWAAGAALHLVAGTALRGRTGRLGAALLCLGAITVVLALDDLLLLHEIFFPWVLGTPEVVTFALYAVGIGGVVMVARRELMAQPEVGVLALALVALGASVVLDVVGPDLTLRRVVEEGLKLLGALAWALFPAQVLVRSVAGASAVGPSPRGTRGRDGAAVRR